MAYWFNYSDYKAEKDSDSELSTGKSKSKSVKDRYKDFIKVLTRINTKCYAGTADLQGEFTGVYELLIGIRKQLQEDQKSFNSNKPIKYLKRQEFFDKWIGTLDNMLQYLSRFNDGLSLVGLISHYLAPEGRANEIGDPAASSCNRNLAFMQTLWQRKDDILAWQENKRDRLIYEVMFSMRDVDGTYLENNLHNDHLATTQMINQFVQIAEARNDHNLNDIQGFGPLTSGDILNIENERTAYLQQLENSNLPNAHKHFLKCIVLGMDYKTTTDDEFAELDRTLPDVNSFVGASVTNFVRTRYDVDREKDAYPAGFFRYKSSYHDNVTIDRRIYINPIKSGIAEVMGFIVREIVDNPVECPGINMAKVAGPHASGRKDRIVIYVGASDGRSVEENQRAVIDKLEEAYRAHPDYFDSTMVAPFEAQASLLIPGIAWAENNKQIDTMSDEFNTLAQSYPRFANARSQFSRTSAGQIRALAIDESLKNANNLNEFVIRTFTMFELCDIDFLHPHLNFSSD